MSCSGQNALFPIKKMDSFPVFNSSSAKTKLLWQEKHVQTKESQIKLLLQEQSDLGLFVFFLQQIIYW